tara:strand:+ start:168 stop:707 length:540 start_codon:yes stop_codon:yes gene_type:complete
MTEIKENLLVFEFDYPFAERVNPILQSQIKERYQQPKLGKGAQEWQPENIHANFTGFNFDSKEVTNLAQWVSNNLTNTLKISLKIAEIWGVLYNEGDYTTPHQHAPSLYSFTYYVNAPKGSSPLVFTTSGKKIKPEVGKVVLFESRLVHHVPPNKCFERCAISGNFIWDRPTGMFKYGY